MSIKKWQKVLDVFNCLDSYDKAILTHYFHNNFNEISNSHNQRALSLMKSINESVGGKFDFSNREELSDLLKLRSVPFLPKKDSFFTFIDLFAGVGGFRLAMQNLGGRCVYSSEWNKDAQLTYQKNFGDCPFGDITDPEIKALIPAKFDILCAGFPCQAFSIAGKQKGFSDTRGTLFFDLETIIAKHRPKVVFLENVKNLVSHDNGKTFKIIVEILEKKLKYKVFYKVLNAMTHANVPQNRERIFIIAFNPKKAKNISKFVFPEKMHLLNTITSVLEKGRQNEKYYYASRHKYYSELKNTITRVNTVYQWRRVYVRENKSNVCPTLTANMGTGGHNVPIIRDEFGIRKLTPKECFSFQGFPTDKYILPELADSKLYLQAGNSVTVPLIQSIGEEIIKLL